jgi:hypothetical protein
VYAGLLLLESRTLRRESDATIMDAKALLSTCVTVVSSHDSSTHNVDAHVAESLDALRVSINALFTIHTGCILIHAHTCTTQVPEDDRAFIQQVAYGILRMERALRAFLNAFYHLRGASISRNDFVLFQILSYIGLFRLSEVGFSRFIGLITSQVSSRCNPTRRAYMMNLLFYLCTHTGALKNAHFCHIHVRRGSDRTLG